MTTTDTPTAGSRPASSARIAWFDEVGAQTERNRPAPDVPLPAPAWARAVGGRGHVTVDWAPVAGAIGYVVHRADGPDGPWQAIDHKAGDLLAVPHPPYVDTTGERGRAAWYAVGAVSSIDAPVWPLSEPVQATPRSDGPAAIEIAVEAQKARGPVERPWRPMIGSEHLAMLLRGRGPGGRPVGEELAEAFRISARELGARSVRAHGILHDSLGVYREVDGQPDYDFTLVDDALARLLETGLRPVVELSFTPKRLASDPEQTVFDYRGIISPPRDLGAWSALVTALVIHLGERFGRDEVRRWPFEVWNEANLKVFWAADQAAYFDLYDATAHAVKTVDPAIRVGGPATAAVGWVDDLLHHADGTGAPVDFVSTHTYGLPPLDLRPILSRFGRNDLPMYWTEWGISPTHGSPINDSVWGAPIVCAGMRSAAGRLDALAYWVASDHFVELGEPERLFHGGFGLLTVGNLRKPRFWALRVLELLGDTEVAVEIDGDGGGGLVDAWATRDVDGRVAIALWNGTIDQSRSDGDPLLDREVRLTVDGLPHGDVVVRHHRIDSTHSNIVRHWNGGDWPDDAGWERLRDHDLLEELGPERRATVRRGGPLTLEFELPMPAVSLIEIAPAS